jgi:hypothetical protein
MIGGKWVDAVIIDEWGWPKLPAFHERDWQPLNKSFFDLSKALNSFAESYVCSVVDSFYESEGYLKTPPEHEQRRIKSQMAKRNLLKGAGFDVKRSPPAEKKPRLSWAEVAENKAQAAVRSRAEYGLF